MFASDFSLIILKRKKKLALIRYSSLVVLLMWSVECEIIFFTNFLVVCPWIKFAIVLNSHKFSYLTF